MDEQQAPDDVSPRVAEARRILGAMSNEMDGITGAIVLMVETTREAVRSLDTSVSAQARSVVDTSYRLDRLSRDLTIEHAEILAEMSGASDRIREQLRADFARQVETLRATFVVATILMLAIVFVAVWLAVPRVAGAPSQAADVATGPAR